MRKKKDRQAQRQRDQLCQQYNGIGIKAVAAAVEPGRLEESEENDPQKSKPSIVEQKATDK